MPNSAAAQQHLAELAALSGVMAVALVESGSGMVWFSESKSQDFGSIAEVAVESWRLKRRHGEALQALGPLKLTATHFERGTLITAPIEPDQAFLLVGWVEGGKLNMALWRERALALAGAMQQRKPG